MTYRQCRIVDNEKRLVGIITVDDAVEVIQDEATEDFELMAAVTPSEDSYMKTGAVRQFLNRIPWLLLLMLSATFTGAIIDSFEERLANISFLIAFIPMLMDTGGNCGSQASILVIRSLSAGRPSRVGGPKGLVEGDKSRASLRNSCFRQ